MRLRILPFERADGPANMGLDLALLDAIDANPTAVVVRAYGWDEPTLSLGYFQHFEEAGGDPRWRDAPIVRRPTGGGAIWHDHDLTYAVVVPRAHPAAARPQVLYRAVHAALAAALRERGVEAVRRADRPEAAPAPARPPFLCFLDRDPEDVVVGGHKVIGSAQRRRPNAVLQHGSILWRTPPATPELAGLDRFLTQADASGWWHDATTRLAEALVLDQATAEVGPPTPAERLAARGHAVSKFATRDWTRRR